MRPAGVLFLGDFWHRRGAIPVAPLAAAVEAFRAWRAPTLLLAGNHDMATLDGRLHALDAVAAAAPEGNVQVIAEPCTALGAAWLPYRRKPAEINAALEAAAAARPAAVFCHADVLGANVNESHQSALGLTPSAFGLAGDAVRGVYSGHYHKPQRLEAKDASHPPIEYVGSPYQQSFSEEGQDKRLLVFSNDGAWTKLDEIALDVGPRHYSVELKDLMANAGSAAALVRNAAVESEALAAIGVAAHEAAQRAGRATHTRARMPRTGDRVRVTLDESAAKSAAVEAAAEAIVSSARDAGVAIDVRRAEEAVPERIEGATSMAPATLLRAYADSSGKLSPQGLAEALALLEQLAAEGVSGEQRPPVHIVFDRVAVDGFGPFKNEVIYELRGRGVRVVTGDNQDGSGSSVGSNGAGKTSLVMAPLWALSGETDPRPQGSTMSGLTGGDVVNDFCDQARVRLEGTVNGEPFVVERVATRKTKGKSLSFTLGDRDLTMQEMRLTQEAIDDALLPAQLLSAVAFHGQHTISVGSIIDSTDNQMKEAMTRVVRSMELWVQASAEASSRLKDTKLCAVAANAEASKVQEFVKRLNDQAAACEEREAAWEQANVGAVDAAERRAESLRNAAGRSQSSLGDARGALARTVTEARALAQAAAREAAAAEAMEDDPSADESSPEVARLVKIEAEQRVLDQQAAGADKAAATSNAERKALLARAATVIGDDNGMAHCDRCLQPVNADVLREGRERLQREADAVAARVATQDVSAQVFREQAAALASEVLTARREAMAAQQAAATRKAERTANLRALTAALQRADAALMTADRAFAQAGNDGGVVEDADAAATQQLDVSAATMREYIATLDKACDAALALADEATEAHFALTQAQAAASTARDAPNPHEGERRRLQSFANDEAIKLGAAKEEVTRLADCEAVAKELDAALGRRGIQSYVLDEALGTLQARTCKFLEELSGGFITLGLSATTASKSKSGGALQRVSREIRVRSSSGEMIPRSLKQCSGGERRRVALALALAYGELAAERSAVRVELLVLDEALGHLDDEGMAAAARLFKQLRRGTVLVVCQANSAIEGAFDFTDVVIKEGDSASVHSFAT